MFDYWLGGDCGVWVQLAFIFFLGELKREVNFSFLKFAYAQQFSVKPAHHNFII